MRLAGLGLAILGLAEVAAIVVWLDQGCWETTQPCGQAPALALWSVWAVLALAVAIAVVRGLRTLFLARHGKTTPSGAGKT